MNTQVSFTTSSQLKKMALERAKQEGLSLKTVLVYAMKGFVEGKFSFQLETKQEGEEDFFGDPEIEKKVEKLGMLLKKLDSKGKLSTSLEEQLSDV